ncbi:MAG: ATPase inhibitor subunit zeta [Rhizomicrobium sp.]
MFEERERGYEAKWAHDAELLFRIMARRDNKLGEWAAARMTLHDSRIDDYVAAVVEAGVAGVPGKGPDPVLEKIRADFAAKGVVVADDELVAKALALREEAEAHFGVAGRAGN